MASFKRQSESNGKTIYNAGIVKGIISLAVSEVSGVAISQKREKPNFECIKVDFTKEGVNVDVSINVYYGFNVPDVAFNIQQNIKHCVESMSEYKILSCDVHVLGIIFDKQESND